MIGSHPRVPCGISERLKVGELNWPSTLSSIRTISPCLSTARTSRRSSSSANWRAVNRGRERLTREHRVRDDPALELRLSYSVTEADRRDDRRFSAVDLHHY